MKEEKGAKSRCARTPPKLPQSCSLTPHSDPGFGSSVFVISTGPVHVHAPVVLNAVTENIIKNKHSQKESKFPFPATTGVSSLHSELPLKPLQPLATRAGAWEAIPSVSTWVLNTVKRSYSLKFTRRPLRHRPCYHVEQLDVLSLQSN